MGATVLRRIDRRMRALASGLMLLLALAGCGGGSESNAAAEASPFGPAAAIRDATPAASPT